DGGEPFGNGRRKLLDGAVRVVNTEDLFANARQIVPHLDDGYPDDRLLEAEDAEVADVIMVMEQNLNHLVNLRGIPRGPVAELIGGVAEDYRAGERLFGSVAVAG